MLHAQVLQVLQLLVDLLCRGADWVCGGCYRGTDASRVPASVLGLIVDLLCFCVVHHSYRIKYYILRNNVISKVPQSHLACSAALARPHFVSSLQPSPDQSRTCMSVQLLPQ